MKSKTEWQWSDEQEKAKSTLTSKTVMAYFSTRSTTEVLVDASPVGLAAILTQKKTIDQSPKIIAYASRSITDVERRYSQTENEGLAIVWGCEHFNLYLSGHRFHLITDHKPLIFNNFGLLNINNNPKSKPPSRIDRWALRLQAYDYKIIYRPGKNNPADYLSRHPETFSKISTDVSHIAEEYINFMVLESVPKSVTLKEIQLQTKNDSLLTLIMGAIMNN